MEIKLRKRPYLARVRNAYRIYRSLGIRPVQALRFALYLQRGR